MKLKEFITRYIAEDRRWLFFLCSLLMFIIATAFAFALNSCGWTTKQSFQVALYTCAGPFSGTAMSLIPLSEPLNWVFGIPGAVLLFLHPMKPSSLTAILTGIGFGFWLFMGLILIYVRV